MSFYPIVKIPAPLERAYRSEPVLADFATSRTVTMPVAPQHFSLTSLAIESGLTTFSSGLGWSMYGSAATSIIAIVGTIFVAAHALFMHLTYPERWYLYHEQVNEYRKQQWQKEFSQARADRLQTDDGIARYRRQKVLAVLAYTKTPTGAPVALNALEEQFARVVAKWWPQHIHTDTGLVLIDPASNLHIRVEIDEPYHNINGEIQVAHYADSAADRQYNDFWLDRGWLVIRFNTQQTIDSADSCCKVIAEVVAELLQDESWSAPFSQIDHLMAVQQWTELEAHRLAKLARRQYA